VQESIENKISKINIANYNENHINEFEKNGYTIIKNAFPFELIKDIKNYADPFGFAPDFPVVLNIHSKMQLFGQIMLNDSLMKFMEILHKEAVSGLTSQYLFKRPNTKYGKQSWVPHQDNAYPKAPHGHYTIVHLALDASNQNNGGLVFWKGSHVEPILPYIYKKSWMEESDPDGIARPGWEIKDIPNQYQKINIELNPGDLCFMHGHLIHGSQSNDSSDLSREQYSMGYCVSGSPFLEGVTSKKRVFTKSDLVQVPIKPEHYEISGQ